MRRIAYSSIGSTRGRPRNTTARIGGGMYRWRFGQSSPSSTCLSSRSAARSTVVRGAAELTSRPSHDDPSSGEAEDFVAMKVDIDGGPELELVTRVADNEGGIAELIDELYFEYHFRFDGLNFGWLTHKGGRNYQKWNHTVDDALALMRRLRRRGSVRISGVAAAMPVFPSRARRAQTSDRRPPPTRARTATRHTGCPPPP